MATVGTHATASGYAMSTFRVIELVRPFAPFLPDIKAPKGNAKIDASERFVWTAASLFIFLACSQIPLYGVHHQVGADPLHWLRMMMASNRGSLMELGITPIVTASTIMQLVQGAGLIQVSMSSDEDRKLFNAAQKLISLLIIFFEALAYVMSGMYGSLAEIGALNAILIVLQLCMTGVIIMVLDDLLQKGYGFGSAISLFIATNVCEQVVWDTFSPTTVNMGRGSEFHGALIALFHMLLTRTNKLSAVRDALYRQGLPNLTGLAATLIVTVVVIFLQGWKVSINLKAKRNPAYRTTFDVKLFYTSNMPIILQSALVSQIYIFSELLYRRFGTNPLIRLLGTWSEDGMGRGSRPTGGFAYYIYAPGSFQAIISDPFQALLYLVFILTCCGALSYMWIWVSGQDPAKTAQRHEDQGLELARTHDKIKTFKDELAAIVPTAAIVGGMAIGALSFFSEIMGARGSGTGILLAVTIIYQYYETFTREGRGGAFNFGDMFGSAGKSM